VITSSTFISKYWAGIENQFVQYYGKGRDSYLLQVKLDDTPIDGLSKHIVFERWNNNAAEIADIIAKKIKLAKNKRLVRAFQWVALCLVLLIFTAGALMIAIPGKITTVSGKTAMDTALANQPKADTSGTTNSGNGKLGVNYATGPSGTLTGKPVIIAKPPEQRLQHIDSVQVPLEKPSQESDYCILVTGSNPDLNNMVASGIREHILARQWSITEKQGGAKKIVKVALQTETTASESVTGMVASSCNYQLSILKADGSVVAAESGRFVKPGFTAASNIHELSIMVLEKVNKFL
jgi:hypothetical protein